MKILTHSIKVAAVSLIAVIGLVACRNDKTDLYAIDANLAQKTLLGIYPYVGVDSVNMNTTIHEWKLENSAEKGRTGYYKVAATGNGVDTDTESPVTWAEAALAADGLSMLIPVTVNGEQKELKWHDGVVEVDGYVTSKSVISVTSTLRAIHADFANLDFVYDDTVSYKTSRLDTTYYLAWKTEVVSFTQDSIDWYKQFMIDNHDTLMWFNATYPDKAVPDTVRFSTKQQGNGTYKGQISRAYEAMNIQTIVTNHGPLDIVNSEMVFNRVGNSNTGSYRMHTVSYTEEWYTNPASDKAVMIEEVYELANAKWTPSAFTNVKKFDILMRGDATVSVLSKKYDGTVIKQEDYTEAGAFHTVSLSAFNSADGEVTSDELKYKTKQ